MGSSDMSDKSLPIQVQHWEDGLVNKLREYLRFGSCDGRVERKALRKELASLIGAEYDEKESRIK